jgi:hypothetical protein
MLMTSMKTGKTSIHLPTSSYWITTIMSLKVMQMSDRQHAEMKLFVYTKKYIRRKWKTGSTKTSIKNVAPPAAYESIVKTSVSDSKAQQSVREQGYILRRWTH